MRNVYFLRRASGDGPIKIGCSVYPEARRKQIGIDLKEPMTLLAEAPGGYREERRLHEQLAEHRLESEWFEASPAVLAVVSYVSRSGKLPPATEDDRDIVMARRYLAGETLKAIGEDFGMTRERVRQILRASSIPSLGWRKQHVKQAAPLTAQELEIADRYISGETIEGLSAAYPKANITSALRRAGVMGKKRRMARERSQTIAEAYLSGASLKDIARRFGMKHETHIFAHLDRTGVKPCRASGNARFELEAKAGEIIAARRAGKTHQELADQFGASTTGIALLLRRHQVTIPRELIDRNRIAAVRAANARRWSRSESAAA